MLSPDLLAAKRELQLHRLRAQDGFAGLRDFLKEVATERGDWAGIPMPLDGAKLVIEPKFPNAADLIEVGLAAARVSDADFRRDNPDVRQIFWSTKHRCQVVIWNDSDGKVRKSYLPGSFNHLDYDLATLMCSRAWGIEQEHRALNLLGTLLDHWTFKGYLLTGMFIETSKRSGLTYMFRKLKPTVVLDARTEKVGKHVRILCALCMHPIAYYEGSWAGAMTPTDDVLAMLMLMRADEHLLWRRANQHPPGRPEAAI